MNTVNERALIQRINRRIGGYDAKTYTVWGDTLRKARRRDYMDLGRYYTIDNQSNWLTGAHIDLEELGRYIGALGPNEQLAEGEQEGE